jgi:lysophospholipase L1-like esterase
MNVKEKLLCDREGLEQYGPVNIVIFGDSVSHGAVDEYNDYENVYWNLLKKKLNKFRDYMPVNMINASIGGTTARLSIPRMERDVLCHRPDLVIVCFGLNDVNGTLDDYLGALNQIFQRCKQENFDVIFMTPNMLNTCVANDTRENLKEYAAVTAGFQNSGKMDEFMDTARELAKSMDVPVCDCYSKWKELSKTQDVTMLLANRINHPTSEMHHLFADELYSMIIGNDTTEKQSDSTMFK